VDDAVAWLSDSRDLPDTLSGVERHSDFEATLAFDDEASAAAVGSRLASDEVPAAMAAALAEVEVDLGQVRIRFTERQPMELQEVEDGHLSACILHTDQS
jgi:hypothetical protein